MATVVPVLTADTADRRKKFLEFVFNRCGEGYILLASRKPQKGVFTQKFFKWPSEESAALGFIQEALAAQDVWYCPMLFAYPDAHKHNVSVCPAAWSDLDACTPDKLLVPPTIVVESSPDRWQALWVFDEVADPMDAQDASKRIARYHEKDGADKSGWDLSQLLRVPWTFNFKYDPPATVVLRTATDVITLEALREAYPELPEDRDATFPFPDHFPNGQDLLLGYKDTLPHQAWMLLKVKPEKDWSKPLWRLEMLLAEAGLSREEMFAVIKEAACNKYARDNRDDKMLWKEVCKAWTKNRERSTIVQDATVFNAPDLMSDEDIKAANADITFIDTYVKWASSVGDAATAYHHAGAFTCLGALTAGSVRLPTSFGMMIPNLWFLLLADTTLTRKSTALDLSVDLLLQVDPDVIMATDGSIEGLFTSLSVRPGRPSIFLRDEFSGLIEMMSKRDYYAGMAEQLTKLYDGKFQKRVLRRETIEVRDPVLIVFAGGIRTKILSLLTTEQVTSGFLPRFIFITAQSDINRLQPLGPPKTKVSAERDRILEYLKTLRERYQGTVTIKVAGQELATKTSYDAELTPGAWLLYNEMERKLLETGVKDTSKEMLTPVMDRLAKSGLKAAILIAASRLHEQVVVDERDIMKAFSFVVQWREYAMDIVSSIGLSANERILTNVYEAIIRHPGVLRSQVMSMYHLNKHEADNIIDTLDQRGKIERVKAGKSERLHPVMEEI
jgi:hypothetical protein